MGSLPVEHVIPLCGNFSGQCYLDTLYPPHGLFAYAHSPTQLNGTRAPPHDFEAVYFYVGYIYIEILSGAP